MPRILFRNKDFHCSLCNKTGGLFKKAYTFYTFYPEYDIAVIIRPCEAKGKVKGYLSSVKLLNDIVDSEGTFVTLDNFEIVANCFKAEAAEIEDFLGYSMP